MDTWASLAAQRLKRLPGMRETWVRSLGWEDPLEKQMATHSSTLAWRIPWREESEKLDLKLNIQKTKIMASGPITSWEIEKQWLTLFFWAPKSLWMVIAAWN